MASETADRCEDDSKGVNFHDMELDERILKATAKLGWIRPTIVQEKAIPLLLEGKDLLMRGRTGSGKTAAFVIPVIQRILNWKETSNEQIVRALILAPSKELSNQIYKNVLSLTTKCSREVRVVDISPQVDVHVQRPLLVDLPDIVVATPARALAHINAKTLDLKHLKMLVVDEADLMFSFGYEVDVKKIIKHLPKIYQATLASATLPEEVLSLKSLLLHNAVTLKLKESELAPLNQLTHLRLYAEPSDKPAILYALVKLGLLRGKSIIFVNTVDKCYRLKLFFHQFNIFVCVLNSELPASVRCHTVDQFNQGKYEIIIASDEALLDNPVTIKTKRRKDAESGVARGIDFQCVSNIINFDFPVTINSYIHRAGRTARGTNKGTVLSFVAVSETKLMEAVDEELKEGLGTRDTIFKDYKVNLNDITGFRYRARDAWKAATKSAVKQARLKEIKQEILNSEKLKSFLLEHPRDMNTLRHDKAVVKLKASEHLSNVPDYLIPPSLKDAPGLLKLKKIKKPFRAIPRGNMKYQAKRKNPLHTLSLDELDEEDLKRRRTKLSL